MQAMVKGQASFLQFEDLKDVILLDRASSAQAGLPKNEVHAIVLILVLVVTISL